MPEEVKFIYMFRYIDGIKTRVKFVLDADNVIVDELPMPNPVNAQQEKLRQLGYEFHQSPTGALVIDKVPPREIRISTFFSAKFDPASCWFPGCVELKAAYDAELEKIGGPTCPDCVKGDLIRKYQEIIRSRWDGDV